MLGLHLIHKRKPGVEAGAHEFLRYIVQESRLSSMSEI